MTEAFRRERERERERENEEKESQITKSDSEWFSSMPFWLRSKGRSPLERAQCGPYDLPLSAFYPMRFG